MTERSAAIDEMIRAIRADYRETARWTGREEPPAQVIDALRRVPRDAFMSPDDAASAWCNRARSIGHGQTISQPFIVALTTDLLEIEPGHRVLEIGTGSGYQAAVLAEPGALVFSIEIVPELASAARARLGGLGYGSVTLREGDGGAGWPEQAPFDRIVATAAARVLPPAWLEQLAAGGRLVAPVDAVVPGRVAGDSVAQTLTLWTVRADGVQRSTPILPVRFVPLTGVAG